LSYGNHILVAQGLMLSSDKGRQHSTAGTTPVWRLMISFRLLCHCMWAFPTASIRKLEGEHVATSIYALSPSGLLWGPKRGAKSTRIKLQSQVSALSPLLNGFNGLSGPSAARPTNFCWCVGQVYHLPLRRQMLFGSSFWHVANLTVATKENRRPCHAGSCKAAETILQWRWSRNFPLKFYPWRFPITIQT
jgi:hypothetical protein